MPELTGPPTGSVVGVTLYNVAADDTRGALRIARAVVTEGGSAANPRWDVPWDGTTTDFQWDATTGGVTYYTSERKGNLPAQVKGIDADAINAASVKADAVSKIQAGAAVSGYTRIQFATYGPPYLLPGTVVDAYLATDTAYTSPQVPSVVAGLNGAGRIDLPAGGSYVLVGRYPGESNSIQAVTS